MKSFTKFDSFTRRLVLASTAALMLSACGGSDSNESSEPLAPGQAVEKYELANDHAIGSKDAPVVIVEYASVVCGACANWHNSVYPEFKEKFVETGKVRFIFREFPTPPRRLADAGFAIANCVDDSKFMGNIAAQYKRQSALLAAQDIGKAYENFAKASGLSVSQYEACVKDEDWRAEYEQKIKDAKNAGVNSTPTFFINGRKQTKVFTIEDFDRVITPLLATEAAE